MYDRLPPWPNQALLLVAMVLVVVGVKLAFNLLFRDPFGYYCKSASQCRSHLCASRGFCTPLCTVDGDCLRGYSCWQTPITDHALAFKWARQGQPTASKDKGSGVCR